MGDVQIEVSDRAERHRYEARVVGGPDATVAGKAFYRRDETTVTFTHTEVDDAFEGKGVGSTLVRWALDDVRRQGLRVRPLCPFVKAYIERHPEYADLVAPAEAP